MSRAAPHAEAPPEVPLGLPTLANGHTVTPTLGSTDPGGSGFAGWYLSESSTPPTLNNPDWSATKPTSFTLSAGDGHKTLYAWVKDTAGNLSAVASASTLLDTTPPTAGSIRPSPFSPAPGSRAHRWCT